MQWEVFKKKTKKTREAESNVQGVIKKYAECLNF